MLGAWSIYVIVAMIGLHRSEVSRAHLLFIGIVDDEVPQAR